MYSNKSIKCTLKYS